VCVIAIVCAVNLIAGGRTHDVVLMAQMVTVVVLMWVSADKASVAREDNMQCTASIPLKDLQLHHKFEIERDIIILVKLMRSKLTNKAACRI